MITKEIRSCQSSSFQGRGGDHKHSILGLVMITKVLILGDQAKMCVQVNWVFIPN